MLEGRDIGTVVFPDAEAKFFLTASMTERARRRRDELAGRGSAQPIDRVRREMEERDRNDSARAHSPLKRAAEAVEIDTTALTPGQVVDLMVARVRALEGRDA